MHIAVRRGHFGPEATAQVDPAGTFTLAPTLL